MSLSPEYTKSFEDAVAPYERQVFFTCLGIMGNPQDAQDCAQDTMLKAFKNYSKFRNEAKLSTWLYSIASRSCMDALRKRKDIVSLDQLYEAGWEKQALEPSPYLQMEESERNRLLRQAIESLPAEHRQVVVLCDMQGLTYVQAAEVINCPVGTVRSRLNRARLALKNKLSTNMELFSPEASLIDERRETV